MNERIRVLHVDDDSQFAELSADLLEREADDVVVETATRAEDALERLDDDVDCVVSDYEMPGTDGIELLEAVRSDHGDVPFILFTGRGSEEVASEAISAGVSDYLQKDSGSEVYAVLANRVRNLVRQSRAEDRLARQAEHREMGERYRKALAEITADPETTFEEKTERLLELGRERLGVGNGHLVKVDVDRGRHEVVTANGSGVVREGISDLSETFCRETVAADEILAIHDATEGEWADDPAAERWGIGCYVGTTLAVDGELYGTLCFVDDDPRDRPFTPEEKAFVDLLGRWFGQSLERRRRRSQAETMFEHAQDAIFLVDVGPDGVLAVNRVNEAFEALSGRASDEVVGRSPLAHVDDDERETVAAQYRTCIDRRDPVVVEEARLVDGERRRWRTRLAPVVEDGSVVQLVGAARDVTERRERASELAERNRQLEAVLDTVEAAIFIKDIDGRYQLMNQECRSVLGIDDDRDVTGLTDDDLFPPDVADQYRADDRRVVETGEPIDVEEEVPTPGGTRTYLTRKSPMVDEAGEVVGICAVATDITDRDERESTLERQVTAIETSIDGMAILDEDGVYEFVNQAHVDAYGYDDREEFLGQRWTMCYDDDQLETFESEVMPALSESGSWRGEAVGQRKDGSTFPQELSLTMLDDGGMVCVVRDITERVEARERVERQNERLQEFASVVSHDLRNPLSVAEGRLDLAVEECDSVHLEEVERAHDRMAALIEDLLTLAREGETATDLQPVDLSEVATDCWRNVETAGAELVVDADATVEADRGRLRQLLENLIRNAVDHGGDDVTVTVDRVADGDGFAVDDDGRGIPVEQREQVLESGFSTAPEGTGFGLSIVSEIAEAHGWSVAVTESDAGGARFEIRGVEVGQ